MGRRRISDVLAAGRLPKAQQRKLRLVLLAREYAFGELGLRRTGAYTLYYDTGGKPVAYNVSAAPKDQLSPRVWSFPIVGSVPYLGFFDKRQAVAMRDRLAAQGLDTCLRAVSAYSSLGWFDDPVYSPMLEASEARLIELVIHESTHTTVFLSGRAGFNESFATFIGQQGTLNLLARLYGPRSPEVRHAQASFVRHRRFAQLISELYGRLEKLYAQPITRRQKIARRRKVFAWAKRSYRARFRVHGSFLRRPLNNAVVLSHGRYLSGLRFHRRVFACARRDLRRMISLLRRAQELGDPVTRVAAACHLREPLPQKQ